MEEKPTQSRERGQGGKDSHLRGPEAAPLVGFGATPQLFLVKSIQRERSTRCRQRSVPASNFARPQTRPQAALPTTCTLPRPLARPHSIGRRFSLGAVFACCKENHLCGGERRRSPEGDRKALWNYANAQLDRKINFDCLKKADNLFIGAGESPLRRRPKGFPIALWKPSASQLLGLSAA